jgi:hypothetical protein
LNSAHKNINIPFKQMRISQEELILVGLVIVYIAFFSHPPPLFVKKVLDNPVGKAIAMLGVLYVTVYNSLIVGVFLAVAFVLTVTSVTEYLDETEQKPATEEKKQPMASGIPPPALTGALAALLKKGDVRLPQKQGKSETTKPAITAPVKPTPPAKIEHFASF